MRNEWCAAPARLALLPSAAQLTATVVIATIHVLVGAIHAALLIALETAAILFGFVAIGYAVRGIMLGTAEMQSKAVELVSSACTLHIPIILAAICNFLLCAVVATHIRRLVAQQPKLTQILLVAMFLLPVVSAGDAQPRCSNRFSCLSGTAGMVAAGYLVPRNSQGNYPEPPPTRSAIVSTSDLASEVTGRN
jgi:hypothetical protein